MEFITFRLRDYHPLSFSFPTIFNYIINFLLRVYGPTTPVLRLVWAVTVSLATTKVIEFLSFPPVTKMFQFTGLSSLELCIHSRILAHYCK